MPDERCGYEKDDGEQCRSHIGLCEEPDCGRCIAHCPHREETAQEARSQGGKATARKQKPDGLRRDELPPLESPQDAEAWCDAVGRAVVTGRVGHNEANAALRAVREWRESHESGQVSERLEALMNALAEWRKTGDPEPVMELVD